MSEEELMHVCKYCERVLVFDDADTVKELLKRLESKGAIKAIEGAEGSGGNESLCSERMALQS